MYRHDHRTEIWHEELREMQVQASLFYFSLEARLQAVPSSRVAAADPWEFLREADDSLRVLVEGGQDREGHLGFPIDDPELAEMVRNLRKRLESIGMIGRIMETSVAGVGFTKEQDSAFTMK